MRVGDLVRVLAHWGGVGTIGIIVCAEECVFGGKQTVKYTLNTGWEYHAHELEVVSAGR